MNMYIFCQNAEISEIFWWFSSTEYETEHLKVRLGKSKIVSAKST